MILTYIIKGNEKNKTLKDILKNKLYISTKSLTNLKQNGGITVNDKNVNVTYIVNTNDRIKVDFSKKTKTKPSFLDKFEIVNKKINILYEDEYLLVVNKDINTPIHPSAYNYTNRFSNYVAYYLKKQNIDGIHIITRLDKNTSGICIFAKNEYIQELFTRKKEDINLTKEYIAIVNNIIKVDHDVITKKIARKKNSIITREINEQEGEFAKTEFFVLKRNYNKNYTVVKLILHTGRTHQIRVHMLSIGHILLGDDLYAKEYNIKNISKYITRQALHAYKVSFNHPITNKKIEIIAKIPEDMNKLIKNDS